MPATDCEKYTDGLVNVTQAHPSFVLEDEEVLDNRRSDPLGRICSWIHQHRASFGRSHQHTIRSSCTSAFCRPAVRPWSCHRGCGRGQSQPTYEVFACSRCHNWGRSLLQVSTP